MPPPGPEAASRSPNRRRPSASRKLSVTDRLPLFSAVQYRLVPDVASGHRPTSGPPPSGSILITSAPSWARVMPPSGAAMKLETSSTVRPSSGAAALTGPGGPAPDRDHGKAGRCAGRELLANEENILYEYL